MRILFRRLAMTLFVSVVIQTAGSAIVAAQDFSVFNVTAQRSQEINDLLNQLRVASNREAADGETTVNAQGQRVFVGQSALRMQQLHDYTLKRLDDLIARPDRERRMAESVVTALADDPIVAKALKGNREARVMYVRTAKSSYSAHVPVEFYQVGAAQFEVNASNNEVIQFGPRPLAEIGERPVDIDFTPRLVQSELAIMARRFVIRHAAGITLDSMKSEVTDKEGLTYFFRWTDPARNVDGMNPFVQVGISRGGEVVSYTNTLSLPESPDPAFAQRVQRTREFDFMRASFSPSAPSLTAPQGGVYIFANNGSYYTQYGPSNWWWTTNEEGYCSTRIASWCNPKYMRYTYESQNVSNYARWTSPYSGWGTHKVFIPRVNATTRWASYDINYNGGSDQNFTLDQLIYSDVWVPTYTLYNIGSTWLYDTMWGFQSPTGKKVGFDEIQIVY